MHEKKQSHFLKFEIQLCHYCRVLIFPSLKLYRLPPGDGGRAEKLRLDVLAYFGHKFCDKTRMLVQTLKKTENRFLSDHLQSSLI